MKLRAIPPANRQKTRGYPSSMRAAARTGFTFVGGHVGSLSQQSAEEQFTPHVVARDPGVAEARHAYQAALAYLAKSFESLCQSAENIAEKDFWQASLARLRAVP